MTRRLWLLVIANVLWFVYAQWQALPTPPVSHAPAVPSLKLVSEAPIAAARCVRIGPWSNAQTAEALRAWLERAHFEFHEHRIEATGPVTFAVTLVSASANAAASISAQLKARGFTDFEVLPPQASAVETTLALGHFSDRGSAQQRVMQLEQWGIHASVAAPVLPAAGGWFEVSVAADAPAPVASDVVRAVPSADGITVAPCPVESPTTPPGVSPAPHEDNPAGAPNKLGVPPTDGSSPGRVLAKPASAPA
jgi:hypothetical protein